MEELPHTACGSFFRVYLNCGALQGAARSGAFPYRALCGQPREYVRMIFSELEKLYFHLEFLE